MNRHFLAIALSVIAAMPAGAQQLTDANIVFLVDQANAADSGRGTLAAHKGTSKAVRAYGRMAAGEHHALRVEGQALARRLGVEPQAPAGDQSIAKTQAVLDTLTGLRRSHAWDHKYVDFEADYHDHMLDVLGQLKDAAQNPELKELIGKAAAVVQHHLDRAEALQKTLKTGRGGGP